MQRTPRILLGLVIVAAVVGITLSVALLRSATPSHAETIEVRTNGTVVGQADAGTAVAQVSGRLASP